MLLRRGAILSVACAIAAWPACAEAAPVDFAHGTIDNQFTTAKANAPTGANFTGSYHAAGDPSGDPPYMRRMTFYPPPGLRRDTSVPDRCTASDIQLQLQGSSACPAGSLLGSGTARGKFMGQESTLDVDQFNAENEVVMFIHSPMIATVGRGKIAPDGSVAFESPTCYPALVTCPADTTLQLGSSMPMKPYLRGGRSYLTTPPKCPKRGYWESPVRFWWADGSGETVVTKQPCTRPKPKKRKRRAR